MPNAICESILIIYNPRGFDFVPQCSRGKEATDSLAISFEVNHFSTMTPLVRPEGFSAQYHDAPGTSQKKIKYLLTLSWWEYWQVHQFVIPVR